MSASLPFAQLYQLNTRTMLNELARSLGRPATLDDLPDDLLQRLAGQGFNWLYLLGAWDTGEAGRPLALSNAPLRFELGQVLGDLHDDDICGSCFAIARYQIPAAYGGPQALQHLRQRLHALGMRLMLDFVPNHTAIDHHWAWEHPEYYLNGTAEDLERHPEIFFVVQSAYGPRILAHGKDPYFPAWSDTLQVDYSNPATQTAMRAELLRIAGQCDGLRCDMAMLLMPDVIFDTWGHTAEPFWPAAIELVRRAQPEFTFLAEVYWNLEWALQQQGFDYTYDKQLYDHLAALDAIRVKKHLMMPRQVLYGMAHFLENHDEPRAARRFPLAVHRAAAIVLYLAPGMRFFQHGQLEGYLLRVPMQLQRGPSEPVDEWIKQMYQSVLDCLNLPAVRQGEWQILDVRPMQGTTSLGKKLIAFAWGMPEQGLKQQVWVVVNYSNSLARSLLRLPFEELRGAYIHLTDHISGVSLERSGDDLLANGLILDLAPWGAHILEVETIYAEHPENHL